MRALGCSRGKRRSSGVCEDPSQIVQLQPLRGSLCTTKPASAKLTRHAEVQPLAPQPRSERERDSASARAIEHASERANERAQLSSTGEVVCERDTVADSCGSGSSDGR